MTQVRVLAAAQTDPDLRHLEVTVDPAAPLVAQLTSQVATAPCLFVHKGQVLQNDATANAVGNDVVVMLNTVPLAPPLHNRPSPMDLAAQMAAQMNPHIARARQVPPAPVGGTTSTQGGGNAVAPGGITAEMLSSALGGAAPAAAPAPVAAPPPRPRPRQSEADVAKIAQLESMGFTREQSIEALQNTNNNVDEAVLWIVSRLEG